MKRTLLILGLIAAAVLVFAGAMHAAAPQAASQEASSTARELRTIHFKGQTLHVMQAKTEAEREQGLSGLPGLPADGGMLFIFDADGMYHFWMKDMRFPIDMVWLSSEGSVVYFIGNVAPSTYPAAFGPTEPSRYVLELPAGWAAQHGVQIGDPVSL
jgi:uncharacterized membrane protein (UPF0127 family)